jgi:hypothetical protein
MTQQKTPEPTETSFGANNNPAAHDIHFERNNLTIRTFMRRFTRLSLGFSKKFENLAAAVALHVAHYNFCRIHSTIRKTPAMAAGVTNAPWTLEELCDKAMGGA